MASQINASNSGFGGIVSTGDSSGQLQLQTAGTTAVTIDTSQNVGIGTSSPAAKLNVTGHSSGIGAIFDKGATTQYGINYKNSAQTYTQYVDVNNNGTNWWALYDTTNAVLVDVYVPGASAYRAFYTVGTERMRIDTSGNVLINGTSSPITTGLFVNTYRNSAAISGLVTKPSTNVNYDAADFFNSSGSYVGYISCTSSATSYVTSSDYRLKENIAPMTGALDKVALLKPVTYTWKIDGSDGQGFIAHELQAIIPDAVGGEKDAVNEDGSIKAQGIDTSFLVATLTAAIQEQTQIINDLKARIETLEAK